MTRITAKREARETGLAAIAQRPRGYEINIDGRTVGEVYASRIGWELEWTGWKIQFYESEKVEKQLRYSPKGNKNGWPMTDEGLEAAKKVALDLARNIYK